jgi:hypothetical protein
LVLFAPNCHRGRAGGSDISLILRGSREFAGFVITVENFVITKSENRPVGRVAGVKKPLTKQGAAVWPRPDLAVFVLA